MPARSKVVRSSPGVSLEMSLSNGWFGLAEVGPTTLGWRAVVMLGRVGFDIGCDSRMRAPLLMWVDLPPLFKSADGVTLLTVDR